MESTNLEYKEQLNDKFEKEVVAFLNTDGGQIILGMDDDGKSIGLENVDEVSLACVHRLKNNILPSIIGIYNIESTCLNGKNIIKINVSSGIEKPYYIKKYGMTPRGCYIRSGSSTISMETGLIESLFSHRVINTLHNVVSPNQHLTFSQLKIYYQEQDFEINEYFLDNLGFYTEDGKFNYTAFLMSDHNSISMKVAKFSGTEKVDLISNDEYGYCCLIKATKNILERLNIENVTSTKIQYGPRDDKRLVDEKALREAVINAIIHQDYINGVYPVFEIYDNRIDVVSSGGLPYGLSYSEFLKGKSVPRNREIMRIFKDMDLVEQLGSGIKRILQVYDENVFEITDNFITVSFPFDEEAILRIRGSYENMKTDDVAASLNEEEKIIIEYLERYPFIKRSTVEDILDIKKTKANKILGNLVGKNIIYVDGQSSNVKYRLKNQQR